MALETNLHSTENLQTFPSLHEAGNTPPPFGTVPVEVVETPDTDDTDVKVRR